MSHMLHAADIENQIKNFENYRVDSNRINWVNYFFDLCYLVAERSPDSQTKHGAVIVDKDNKIVSTGYNGFPSGGPDNILPNQRPAKYPYIIHAEMNAPLSARCDVRGCIVYITGMPCKSCLLHLVGAGIRTIFIGNRLHVEDVDSSTVRSVLCYLYGVTICSHSDNNRGIIHPIWPKNDD